MNKKNCDRCCKEKSEIKCFDCPNLFCNLCKKCDEIVHNFDFKSNHRRKKINNENFNDFINKNDNFINQNNFNENFFDDEINQLKTKIENMKKKFNCF